MYTSHLFGEGSKTSEADTKEIESPYTRCGKKWRVKNLDARIIYPISDSSWVSPTQVVPKKSGIIVIKNDQGELILTRLTIGWRVCIDFRKLNSITKKDHFLLHFLDQVLERVFEQDYYFFLDGY